MYQRLSPVLGPAHKKFKRLNPLVLPFYYGLLSPADGSTPVVLDRCGAFAILAFAPNFQPHQMAAAEKSVFRPYCAAASSTNTPALIVDEIVIFFTYWPLAPDGRALRTASIKAAAFSTILASSKLALPIPA